MPNTQESIESMGGIPEITMEVVVSGMTQTAVDKTLSITDMAADAKATGDAINNVIADVADLAADISEVVDNVVSRAYPVGTVYMSVANQLPAGISEVGTWVEIGVTATWAQLKTGKRGYAELEAGDTGGTLHFWLRTA